MDPAITTGLFTLLAGMSGLLGVRMTLRHGERLREQDRREERRREERTAVVEVLDAGYNWRTAAESMTLTLGTITDPVEVGNSWGMDRMVSAGDRYGHALVDARLTVQHPEVAAVLAVLTALRDQVGPLNRAIMDSARRHGLADSEPMGRAWAFPEGYKKKLDELEQVALRVYAAPAPLADARRRWGRRLRRVGLQTRPGG